MNKKIVLSLFIIFSLVFSCTFVFAEGMVNDAVNGVRNAVGGAENALNDAGNAVKNTVTDMTNATKSGTENVENGMNNITNNISGITSDNYTATKTATTSDNTFLGMNSTTWTWIVLAVAAVVIIGLVWYYSSHVTRDNTHHE